MDLALWQTLARDVNENGTGDEFLTIGSLKGTRERARERESDTEIKRQRYKVEWYVLLFLFCFPSYSFFFPAHLSSSRIL
jgi:hypothetical protein